MRYQNCVRDAQQNSIECLKTFDTSHMGKRNDLMFLVFAAGFQLMKKLREMQNDGGRIIMQASEKICKTAQILNNHEISSWTATSSLRLRRRHNKVSYLRVQHNSLLFIRMFLDAKQLCLSTMLP
ncbi:hypothetical protein V5799_003335 [Amblyomma americanum]|uniref:Uncharacterized protein n=1 Tax=Amblyomma americanum TaxID=6943 RepID=A0AAQ4D990_AMBAM